MKIIYKIENDLCVDIIRIADGVPIPEGYQEYTGRTMPTVEELSTQAALDAEEARKLLISNVRKVLNCLSNDETQALGLLINIGWLYRLTELAGLTENASLQKYINTRNTLKGWFDSAISEADLGNDYSPECSFDLDTLRNFLL